MSPLLEIVDLHASHEEVPILRGVDLVCRAGETHAIMGPNGSGKSTLAQILAGHRNYEATAGEIRFMGGDLTAMSPDERAIAGIFLGFQYPVEIPGIVGMTFLKTALESVRRGRGEPVPTMPDFIRAMREKAELLQIPFDQLKRPLNAGFSGGEKKRFEILQALALEPRLSILDETDSGLDVDALRIVGEAMHRLSGEGRAMILITHYHRLLDYVEPDFVHILSEGRIVESGAADLARRIEREGYKTAKTAKAAKEATPKTTATQFDLAATGGEAS